jgi:hypothetical protein
MQGNENTAARADAWPIRERWIDIDAFFRARVRNQSMEFQIFEVIGQDNGGEGDLDLLVARGSEQLTDWGTTNPDDAVTLVSGTILGNECAQLDLGEGGSWHTRSRLQAEKIGAALGRAYARAATELRSSGNSAAASPQTATPHEKGRLDDETEPLVERRARPADLAADGELSGDDTRALEASARVEKALSLAFEHAGHDGAHHKDYCIDQMVRALTGCLMVERSATDVNGRSYSYSAQGESPEYLEFVRRFCAGEDGPNTYDWECGIP